MGALRDATDELIAGLDNPNVALVAAVRRLADTIDSDYYSASHFKEYRLILRDLSPQTSGPSLSDLVDD